MTENTARELLGEHFDSWKKNAIAARGVLGYSRRLSAYKTLKDIVTGMFVWRETPEGTDFWKPISLAESVSCLHSNPVTHSLFTSTYSICTNCGEEL